MRLLFTLLLTVLSASAIGQSYDSAWLLNNYLPQFYKDTGTYLQPAIFVDEGGNKKTLDDFKGKVLYVDVWATSCAPCIAKFPYQEQLLKRLKVLHLDTSIVFININTEDSENKWKKALQKYHPTGINLFSGNTTLYTQWNIDALPCYIILDASGKVLCKTTTGPDDAYIDWILYSASRGVHPVEAIWKAYAQDKLMEQHRSASAFTDQEYAQWYRRLLPAFLEFNKWRQVHQSRQLKS